MGTNILRLPALIARTGLSRSTIYAKMSDHAFPKSISLGSRAVGWIESEIEDWIENQVRQSREKSLEPPTTDKLKLSGRGWILPDS